jgi:CARDB
MKCSARSVLLSIGIGLIASLGLLASTAHAAKAAGKPDLVVTKVRVEPDTFAFIGQRWESTIDFTVVNKGRGTARASDASIFIKGGGQSHRVQLSGVQRLASGESGGALQGVRRRNDLEAGEWTIGVCADANNKVKESNERNNCTDGKPKFYSAYRTYKGFLLGERPGISEGAIEAWQTTSDTTYGPGQYVGRGLFIYKNTAASAVRYQHSGSGGGCSYSGEGTFAIDGNLSQIMLNLKAGIYTANATTLFGSQYMVTLNCGAAGTYTRSAIVGGTPALLAVQEELKFGHTRLVGSTNIPTTPTESIEYFWDLAGV